MTNDEAFRRAQKKYDNMMPDDYYEVNIDMWCDYCCNEFEVDLRELSREQGISVAHIDNMENIDYVCCKCPICGTRDTHPVLK